MRLEVSRTFVVSWLLLVGTSIAPAALQAQRVASPVVTQKGDLPILLSAPHGGNEALSKVPVRQGNGVQQFKVATDSRTAELTQNLADALERELGKRPYLVIAKFHRKYVDANRPATEAYESEFAQAAYDQYHQSLVKFRQDIERRWGRGLVLDIHGQALEPKAILRGTQNGKTTTHLLNRFGQEALVGKSSLFGQFEKQGLAVIPAVDSAEREHDKYDGGYIVRTYGSSAGGTLDALQLELGSDLRSSSQWKPTAQKLALAIAAFAEQYLPAEEQIVADQQKLAAPTKVHVGVYKDQGSGKSIDRLKRALQQHENVTIHELKADAIRDGALQKLDVLIQPGGSGSAQGRNLGVEGRQKIRQFVRSGGGYIGICAGAYLASADYEWSLNILDAKVLDRQHWARGNGMVEIELTKRGCEILHSKESQRTIYYGQGPLLAPANHPDIDDYELLASYKTEIAKNGAPKGVMPGTTAIAQGSFGKGRVFCFSPHPELTQGLEDLLQHAIDQVKRKQTDEQKPPAGN